MLDEGTVVAGKTGTTDEMRDSWFAGFSADRLAVVWLGRDDNKPAGLSGASGALLVWGDIMQRIEARSLAPRPPVGVQWQWIDPDTGYAATQACPSAVHLPFIAGTGPTRVASCGAEQMPAAAAANRPRAKDAKAVEPAPLVGRPKPERRNSPLDWLTDGY
jgi:penicillin-binding protein 1B